TDNSGNIAGYSVFVDGNKQQDLGADHTSADAGAFDPTASRLFPLAESDAAGNVSEQTQPLKSVPTIVGLTPTDARAALEARGFAVGAITKVSSTAAVGTVVGPADLVLAESGAAIDLQISDGGAASTKLVFSVIGTRRFSWTKRTFIGARVTTTRASAVVATLVGPGGQRLYTWRVKAHAGASILKLPMPKQVRRPGTYTLVWAATAGGTTIRKSIPVRIVGSDAALGKPVNPGSL